MAAKEASMTPMTPSGPLVRVRCCASWISCRRVDRAGGPDPRQAERAAAIAQDQRVQLLKALEAGHYVRGH